MVDSFQWNLPKRKIATNISRNVKNSIMVGAIIMVLMVDFIAIVGGVYFHFDDKRKEKEEQD